MGRRRGCEMDASALPPGLQTVAALALAKSSSSPPPSEGANDLRQHVIEIVTGETRRELRFDDLNMPADLAPLVDHLASSSRPLPLE